MASHFQPTDEQVDQLLMLVNHAISRQEAVSRLKGNNYNVEQALNEYYDTADSANNKYRWDEAQFNSDREGASNAHGISFDIHTPDDPGAFNQYDIAPSRPPSRASNNKSPLSKVVDLTAEHAAVDPKNLITHDYNVDSDLEQALAASRADLGMPPQESGTTTASVCFGPATRNRKREPGTPAFLKPSVQDTRLNAFITIYHSIPLARNVLLNTYNVLPTYGHDAEWWQGKAIEQPSTVTMHGASSPPLYDEAERELQRLMAFLDNTERSYGSVEVLANLPEVKQAQRLEPDLPSAVLRAWKTIVENRHSNGAAMIRQIFSTGVPDEDSDDAPTNFAVLALDLPPKDSVQETLYDICDEVLWPQLGIMDLSKCPYLSRIAEVISFKVDKVMGGSDSKNVEIPAVWYPDRYLKAGRQAALDMRLKKREVEQELERIRSTEEKLSLLPLKSGKYVKVHDLFKASLKHDEAKIEADAQLTDVDVMVSQSQSNAAMRLSEELRKVVASIDKKLLALEAEKEKARAELRSLSKLYTEPSSDPEAPTLHRYNLRGVSITKNTMFICKQAEADMVYMGTHDDGSLAVKEQWWRIEYTYGTIPFVIEKSTLEKVLEAAMESEHAILVYASDKALNHPHIALPKALETFVRFDNRTFRSEFQDSEDSHTVDGDDDSPTLADTFPVGSSPGKRKYDESSLVNQDFNLHAQVNITARELRNDNGSDGSNIALLSQKLSADVAQGSGSNAPEDLEVIMGVPIDDMGKETPSQTQEMQERNGMPLLSTRPQRSVTKPSTVDSMDIDQVTEDGQVARESDAVKRVGFAE
ncbi:ubiquitin interaction domain-containing protein [Diplocarpon rosae]|nr:ubiquitin interaction domain-containing protein [Diplocarpon rosae]